MALANGGEAMAQCDPQFAPLLQRTTVDGRIVCSQLWDPDGAGPLAERLVVGGVFTAAGGVAANNIAVYDFATATWSALGAGVRFAQRWPSGVYAAQNGEIVTAMAVAPDQTLVVVGSFTHAGSSQALNVARWNGTTWAPLGGGVTLEGQRWLAGVACQGNGDVVVCGDLSYNGHAASRWNGSVWTLMPGLPDSPVGQGGTAILARQNGELVIANDQSYIGMGVVAECGLYRWTGSAWSALGTSSTTLLRQCRALTETNTGTLLAGGFGNSGASVRAFDGTSWSTFGTTSLSGTVSALVPLAGGGAVVALDAVSSGSVWSTSAASGAWSLLGTADAPVASLVVRSAGEVIASGGFDSCGVPAARIAQWNGTWSTIGAGTQDGRVLCATATPAGYVVGGSFRNIGGVPAAGVAEWTGTAWQSFGAGLTTPVVQLARRSNGELIARRRLSSGLSPVHDLARWDGVAWSPFVPPVGNPVAIAVLPNDTVAVASLNQVHLWNGSAWTTLPGTLGSGGSGITAMTAAPNGDLIVGGWFFFWAGSTAERIVRWNGSAWQAIGTGPGGVSLGIEAQANGEILVAGHFYYGQARYVGARWNGAVWSPVGSPCREDRPQSTLITREPNGDVLVAGPILEIGGLPMQNLARWSNGAWWPVARTSTPSDWLRLPNGDLLVCGTARIDDLATGDLVRYTPNCAPLTAAIPALCIGPIGTMTATAVQPAQLGSTLVTQSTGFTPTSIALAVYGGAFLTTQLHLALVLPGALPGCELVPSPEITNAMLPVAGVATAAVSLPSSATLVGVKLWQQFVQLDLAASGAIQSIATSNAVMLRLF
jgi:trimeric autotransporter adhesin